MSHAHDHGHGHDHDHGAHGPSSGASRHLLPHAGEGRALPLPLAGEGRGEGHSHAPRPADPGFSLFRLSATARLGGALAATAFVWLGVVWALD